MLFACVVFVEAAEDEGEGFNALNICLNRERFVALMSAAVPRGKFELG